MAPNSNPKNDPKVASDAIVTILKAALTALKGAPALVIVFVVVTALADVVAIYAATSLLLNDRAIYSFILYLVVLIPPTLVFLRLLRVFNSIAPPKWNRAVPKYPIVDAIDKMSELLEQVRLNSFKYLNSLKPELTVDQIRANIFVADYSRPREGMVFELVMDNFLRKNMNNPGESDIRFIPGQGATGKVFIDGIPAMAKRQSGTSGTWESIYQMSDELNKKLDPELKWIVSTPLRDRKNQSTLAVLNIDGLVHEFDYQQLGKMKDTIFKDILVLADLMARDSKMNLSIHVEEV